MKSVLSINCGECLLHLPDFLHGDVSPLLRRQMGRHLDYCPACYEQYLQGLDLMRDLKREVPRIGTAHQPRFDQVWAAIQQDIAKPKSTVPRFHIRYGLAMVALMLVFLVPLTMASPKLTFASPPPQAIPLTQHATPSGTASGALETAVAISFLTDQSQVTPEAPQRTTGPSLDVISTP